MVAEEAYRGMKTKTVVQTIELDQEQLSGESDYDKRSTELGYVRQALENMLVSLQHDEKLEIRLSILKKQC